MFFEYNPTKIGSTMNKIVLNFGLLVFFLSIIMFSQQSLSIIDVIIRSIAVFIVVTVMLSILALAFIKAINKTSVEKGKTYNDNLIGNNPNE